MYYRRLGLVGIGLALTGCANLPHNNVLLFGTDTKVALDVSSSATSGGAPQITLGYRRAEAVWMPLAVNDQDCNADRTECRVKTGKETVTTKTNPPQVTERPALYQAEEHKDGKVERKDSYSVLASFGAKFAGTANAGEASASGGLAQFFATGIAAQQLAANTSIGDALKVNNPMAAKAEAEEAKANAEKSVADLRLEALRQELSPGDFDKATGAGVARRNSSREEARVIIRRCGSPDKNKTKWQSVMDAAAGKTADPGVQIQLVSGLRDLKTEEDAISSLAALKEARELLINNLGTLCAA